VARNQELHRLEQSSREALARGEPIAAAEHHAEAASLWLQEGEPARAEFHLVQARELAVGATAHRHVSRYARALGRLWQDQARFDDAVRAYTEASARGRMAPSTDDALLAEVLHANMLAKAGRLPEALGLTNASIDYAVTQDLPADLAALLENRARHEMSLGAHQDALDTLAVAIKSAQVAEDAVKELRLAWSRHQLERGLGQLPTDDFDGLRRRQVELTGVDDVGWEMDLLQAALDLQSQRPGPAAEGARRARDGALGAMELPTYLQACLLLADIEVSAGRRPAALMVLLAAHDNLRQLLGDEAAAPVRAMLERFRRQWGDAVFDTAFAELRAHVEAQRPT